LCEFKYKHHMLYFILHILRDIFMSDMLQLKTNIEMRTPILSTQIPVVLFASLHTSLVLLCIFAHDRISMCVAKVVMFPHVPQNQDEHGNSWWSLMLLENCEWSAWRFDKLTSPSNCLILDFVDVVRKRSEAPP
jgi:hypothetical protein